MKKLICLLLMLAGVSALAQPIVRSPWTTQVTPTAATAGTVTFTGNMFFTSADANHAAIFPGITPPFLAFKTGDGLSDVNVSFGSATISGNINAVTAVFSGAVSAGGSGFTGPGQNLTSLNAANISSGTVATARLGSGTANSTTALFGDSTYKSVVSAAPHSVQSIWIFTGPSQTNLASANYFSMLGSNGVGSKTITSAMVNQGTTIRVKVLGNVNNTGGGVQNFRVMLDATNILDSTVIGPGYNPGLGGVLVFEGDFTITFRSIGVAGSVVADAIAKIYNGGTSVNQSSWRGSFTNVVDTTASHVLEVLFSPNASAPNLQITDQAIVDYTP